ncbi:MAG: glycosyltransferase family 4 protein [Oligoflexia bacterium]|nr:glycosyltransferase family 4 protein [Oligoflexia bacterium]
MKWGKTLSFFAGRKIADQERLCSVDSSTGGSRVFRFRPEFRLHHTSGLRTDKFKMKVVMLGWEYPPQISGGLGTACEGLTRSLARHEVDIRFVVPYLYGSENAPHMTLVDPTPTGLAFNHFESIEKTSESKRIRTERIEAFLSPYWTPEVFERKLTALHELRGTKELRRRFARSVPKEIQVCRRNGNKYGQNIFEEVGLYTSNVLATIGSDRSFDLIHAHDWMTYPAGVALAELTGKPLVVHVHSLEYDRSGANVNHEIDHIERMGTSRATKVIAVSHYTKSLLQQHHGLNPEKIAVVHNGVYPREATRSYQRSTDWPEKSVLFLGRVTFQKGPDYFVEAAARVIEHVPGVVFIMAGSGDMLDRMVQRTKELEIQDNFWFPGFVRGAELERMLSLADLYVMPSVSEPFGISALEAISFDTPAIISRQSGVSEVLDHALKVDFWDVDRLADLIINGLLHQELREDMISMAREEVKRLRWDAAADKTFSVYSGLAH